MVFSPAAAAAAIRARLGEARRRGLWASRLNSAAALLDAPWPAAAE